MEGHEERAAELEYELADMEKQQDKLDDSIHAAQDDWEAKKRDPSVPGAGTAEEIEGEAPEGEGEPEVEDEKS
jgi:predicted  nucleic acid-binding Zn-ribbon protein